MKIGITGTREGANLKQLEELKEVISSLAEAGAIELHHGDCAGVDFQAAKFAQELELKVICHPPESDYLRAFHNSDEFREPADYLTRDRNIVDETDVLIVVPKSDTPTRRSGTWYTYRYAEKVGRPIYLIYTGAEK